MYDGKDEILIMQNELKTAVKSSNPKWAMVISTKACAMCQACTIGCMVEHKSPPGIRYRPVYETEEGKYPDTKRQYTARPCQHCDNPPCVQACPVSGKATWKGTEGISTGIVMINYKECIGCGKCIPSCPYGARLLDDGSFHAAKAPFVPEMEKGPAYEYAGKTVRDGNESPVGNARKCHFCYHRLKEGMLPMCVTTCIGRATFFGDLNNSGSMVSRLMKENKTVELSEVREFGDTAKKIAARKFDLKSGEWKTVIDSATAAYPGKTPVFGKSSTNPKVFYII